MSDYATIRDAIKTILSGVAGIGVVHTRQRFATDQTKLKALYVKDGILNGWIIRRVATPEARDTMGGTIRRYRFRIRGYYAFADSDVDADSSEQKFQALIEGICDTFRPNPYLNDAALEGSDPIQVVEVLDVVFAGVTAHAVDLDLMVDDQQTV